MFATAPPEPAAASLKRPNPLSGTRDDDQLIVTPLGGGSEVGRSCIHLSYKGKNVLLDSGIHPGYTGNSSLPYFDAIDPSTVDLLLVTHFHLDHAASLPYFLEKTTFKGRVFMTHATKAIYKLLLTDYIKVTKVSVEETLFDEQDIVQSMDKIEVIDFHQEVEVNGIRFWCYTAGHVLGAAMFMVDIAGTRVLYTGDYSREEDRHLRAAELPEISPHVCIIESTYGVQLHQPRHVRERRFTDVIHNAVSRGGRVLIPAFALGRAQELLLILDEYWSNHPELHNVPIYYASPLAKRCLAVYQTYINSMNDTIKSRFAASNPFDFKHISYLNSVGSFNDMGPCVVMASPGGMQSGLSRQLFDRWCSDEKNACVIPGYVVNGTLAKTILSEPNEVNLMNGVIVPLKMRVHYISFSAHADYAQTSSFLEELDPKNIILVHGEAREMGRLQRTLLDLFSDRDTKVLAPKNCQPVEMYFKSVKIAKITGAKAPEVGQTVRGLLVKKGFSYQIIAPEDLHVFTDHQVQTTNVVQRITIPYCGALGVIKHRLKKIYEAVESLGVSALRVEGRVTVKHESERHVSVHWNGDPVSDLVADSVVAVVLGISGKKTEEVAEYSDDEEEDVRKAEKIYRSLLVCRFGDVRSGEEGKLVITVDGDVAVLDIRSGGVECEHEGLRLRVLNTIQRMRSVMKPVSAS